MPDVRATGVTCAKCGAGRFVEDIIAGLPCDMCLRLDAPYTPADVKALVRAARNVADNEDADADRALKAALAHFKGMWGEEK